MQQSCRPQRYRPGRTRDDSARERSRRPSRTRLTAARIPRAGQPGRRQESRVGQWTKTATMRLMIVNANVRCAIVADGFFTAVAAGPSAGADAAEPAAVKAFCFLLPMNAKTVTMIAKIGRASCRGGE